MTERVEDMQACACRRIVWRIGQTPEGWTRGWHACELCGTRYVSQPWHEHALAQAERERDEARSYIEDFKHSIQRVSEENIDLRGEVERLQCQAGKDHRVKLAFQRDLQMAQAKVERLDIQASREMHRANQAESDRDRAEATLARVRAALEEMIEQDRMGVFSGANALKLARAALEGRG